MISIRILRVDFDCLGIVGNRLFVVSHFVKRKGAIVIRLEMFGVERKGGRIIQNCLLVISLFPEREASVVIKIGI